MTRPVWWWQRHRPYPIRARARSLPAQSWHGDAARLVVLTTPRTLDQALWTAWSFGGRLADCAGVEIVLDGVWSEPLQGRARAVLPGATLRETREAVAAAESRRPALAAFATAHPLGRKLLATLDAQRRSDTVFSDDDVLAFGALSEIRAALATGVPRNRYLREQGGQMNRDPAVLAVAARLGLPSITDLNDGLLVLRRDSLDADLAERLLAGTAQPFTWFTGTTVMAVMLAHAGAQVLPPSYLVSTAGQFYHEHREDPAALDVRHYVSPVRHLMFTEGAPWLLASARPPQLNPER